jgi:hypothetical protein
MDILRAAQFLVARPPGGFRQSVRRFMIRALPSPWGLSKLFAMTGWIAANPKSCEPDRRYRRFVGPVDQYDFMGATQFRLLTTLGLREEHYLLDIGCGSLRAGRLLIPYLLPDRYHGIEPDKFLLDAGIANEVGTDLVRLKRPRFAHNSDFDFSEPPPPLDDI